MHTCTRSSQWFSEGACDSGEQKLTDDEPVLDAAPFSRSTAFVQGRVCYLLPQILSHRSFAPHVDDGLDVTALVHRLYNCAK
jgi:hypothetical protein